MKNKGITLVALVITIIILLMLAGISIQVLTNQGLFAQADSAKKETEIANIKEQVNLDIYQKQLEPPLGNITQVQLESILSKYGVIVYEENGTTIKSIKTESGYEILLADIYSGSYIELQADGSWNSAKKVNSPKLMQGMTGIYWDESGNEVTVTADNQDNWYNYSEQKWANAKTKDGSYWVWIPRYAYKITSNCNTSTAGTIAVEFLQGITNKNASGTEISKTYPTVTNNAMDDFVVHPSFTNGTTNNFMNGEWDDEIPGFWVAKYAAGFQECTQTVSSDGTVTEPTTNLANVKYSDKYYTTKSDQPNCTTNALSQILTESEYRYEKLSYPVFKPLTYAYNMISVGDSYIISKEIANASSFYGLSSSQTDSHQMKNSEWGAVAYLTQSSCGRNKIKVTINSKNLKNKDSKIINAVTGYAESIANGVSASSTNNKTGVFDLNGCIGERTATYISNGNGNLATYGKSFALLAKNIEGYKTLSTKYVTVYPYNSAIDNNVKNYDIYKELKSNTYGFGDAILETSSKGENLTSWKEENSLFFNGPHSFFIYGGHYGMGASTGIFSFQYDYGAPTHYSGFRAILIGK